MRDIILILHKLLPRKMYVLLNQYKHYLHKLTERWKKEAYRLVSLFPNEMARDEATSVLGKGV